jgi:hypothetical protein
MNKDAKTLLRCVIQLIIDKAPGVKDTIFVIDTTKGGLSLVPRIPDGTPPLDIIGVKPTKKPRAKKRTKKDK